MHGWINFLTHGPQRVLESDQRAGPGPDGGGDLVIQLKKRREEKISSSLDKNML